MTVVTIDAFDTLIALEPPVPRLTAALEGLGRPHPPGQVAAAFMREVDYYRGNHMRGADPASLGDLRYDCARELAAGLEDPPPIETLVEVLLAALRFRVLDDAPPALTRLAERGVRLAVVSNWDCSLAGILTNLGIAGRFEVIISSAEVGAAKPAPEPFLAALECMGVPPSREVLHCGDSPEADGAGAEAAGITPVIVDREDGAGAGPGDAGYRVIRRLTELADDL